MSGLLPGALRFYVMRKLLVSNLNVVGTAPGPPSLAVLPCIAAVFILSGERLGVAWVHALSTPTLGIWGKQKRQGGK